MENLSMYIRLISPSHNKMLEHLKQSWNFDWCTFEDFNRYIMWLWVLNQDAFKQHVITFEKFLEMETILLKYSPNYFKISMKLEGFI